MVHSQCKRFYSMAAFTISIMICIFSGFSLNDDEDDDDDDDDDDE